MILGVNEIDKLDGVTIRKHGKVSFNITGQAKALNRNDGVANSLESEKHECLLIEDGNFLHVSMALNGLHHKNGKMKM